MVLKNGDVVKFKKCKRIDSDFWGDMAIVEDEPQGGKVKFKVRYQKLDFSHGSFECNVEDLEKVND